MPVPEVKNIKVYVSVCQTNKKVVYIGSYNALIHLPDPYRTHCITFWSSFIELGTYVSLVQEVQKVQNGNWIPHSYQGEPSVRKESFILKIQHTYRGI